MFEKKYAIIFLFIIGFSFNNVYAEIEYGPNYDREILQTNPNGSQIIKHTLNNYERIFYNNQWVDFILNDNQVQTSLDTVILNNDGSFTWVEKGITDKIIVKYADISNLNSWTYPNTLNNDIPDNIWNGTSFISTKNKSGIGNFNYIYDLNRINWKTQLEATNLSSLTTKVFGFDEIFDIQSDTIKFGGITRNLDNFNGTVFLKPWLDNNKGKVLDLLNDVTFDFDKSYENLYSITVYDTGINSSRLIFDYRTTEILLPGETLILDPTFIYSDPSTEFQPRTSSLAVAVTCESGTYTNGTNFYQIYLEPSGSTSNYCSRSVMTWNTISIPDTATITNVNFKTDIVSSSNSENCNIMPYLSNPNTDTPTQLWTNSASGTPYINNNAWCKTVANDNIFDLGTSADTDLQNNLGNDRFSLAIKMTTEARAVAFREVGLGGSTRHQIEVTYTLPSPPDAITDLTLDSVTQDTATVSFTPPGLNGESLQTYSYYLQTPQTNNVLTFFTNSTDNPVTLTGLNSNTQYSLNATANTIGGQNFTGMNILNFTTLPNPPSNLTGLSSIFTPLQVLLSWNGNEENIQGFKIERESPVSGGFVTLVNDTGNDTPFYEDNDVLENVQYNYRVSAWLDELTDPSNEFSITISPSTEPNFTDLEFEPFNLSWTSIGSNPIMLDTNQDGLVDNIYTRSGGGGSNVTYTKVIGTGVSSVSVANTGTGTIKEKVYVDEIWLGAGSTSTAYVSIVNVLTGEVQPNVHSQTLDRSHTALFDFFKGYQYGNVTIGVIGGTNSIVLCGSNIYCADLEVSTPTATITDQSCDSSNTNGSPSISGSKEYMSLVSTSTGGCNLDYKIDKNFGTATGIELSGTQNGWCSTISCQTNNSDSIATISPSVSFPPVPQAYTIKKYVNGFELPSGDDINSLQPLWTDYISNISTNYTKILNMHYKILDPTLTDPVSFALFYDNTTLKLLQLGSTLKYADIPDINDRTFDLLLLDDYTGADYPTLSSVSTIANYTPYITSITTVYPTVNTKGAVSLPSGYKITPDATTTSRQFISDFTDSEDLVPGFLGITSGLTELSILVKNAPEYFGLLIYDENELDNTRYLWSAQELQADNTITVDLPSGLCVYVVGTTFNTLTPETNEFGQLCASGTMPKTIFYSSNLSFTFWTLPYGVSHTFTQESSTLTTKVRANTVPFEYTVELYDSEGALQYQNTFVGNTTAIDQRTINATGISLPALLKVFDDDDHQIYYSTIGTPGYFSGTVSWFAQYLTIDGFNLLFLLPLVFGAMFTRNTVSVGTVITVVFIATLTWLGIIPLPDIVIYLLIFIGVIGMIAYKRIYD